jgi:probable rRNA maturation factor
MDCVTVQIFEEFENLLSEGFLGRVAQLTLDHEKIDRNLSLVIADDDTVRELNKTYRGLDKTTDVLSFAFDNQGQFYGDEAPPSDWDEDVQFVLPDSEEGGLGEIIISYPQAARQAAEAGRDVKDEVTHLITHGILHLLGHDHIEDDEHQAMAAKEMAISAEILSVSNE